MKCRNFICLLLIFISANSLAQSSFHYHRGINGVTGDGWYALPLPPGIFKNLRPDFGDIRMYSLIGKDTLELPYLLEIRSDHVTRQTVDISLVNKTLREGVLYLTFELKDGQKANSLDLAFENPNYVGFVTIQGSNDKLGWFEITKDQRIVSDKNKGNAYPSSNVTFPLSDYRFLRVAVTTGIPLAFQGASFENREVEAGDYRNVPLTWSIRSDEKTKLSIVDIRLTDAVPLSSVVVETDSTGDFYRSLRIEYLRDSTKTDSRWVRYYDPLYEGQLTSFKPNEFQFDWLVTKELRLVIRNNDNAPIPIRSIAASGPDARIVAYFKRGRHFMLYGSPGMRAPSYDLAHFENKIPPVVMKAEFGAEENISADKPGSSPLFENKIWLWGVMGLMIGGLGFFTLKMMKKEE